jgi:hypothetical protein
MNPAVECVISPSRPSEDLPSRRAARALHFLAVISRQVMRFCGNDPAPAIWS